MLVAALLSCAHRDPADRAVEIAFQLWRFGEFESITLTLDGRLLHEARPERDAAARTDSDPTPETIARAGLRAGAAHTLRVQTSGPDAEAALTWTPEDGGPRWIVILYHARAGETPGIEFRLQDQPAASK